MCILIVENMVVMLFKQKITRALPKYLIVRAFDNYFSIRIALDLNTSLMEVSSNHCGVCVFLMPFIVCNDSMRYYCHTEIEFASATTA